MQKAKKMVGVLKVLHGRNEVAGASDNVVVLAQRLCLKGKREDGCHPISADDKTGCSLRMTSSYWTKQFG